MLRLQTIVLFTLLGLFCSAQQTMKYRKISKSQPPFTYEFTTLKNDTTIYEGWSKTVYKQKVIEQGKYANNECVGKWQFFSFKGVFEYEFDFDTQTVTKISGSSDKPPYKSHPSFFLGSPIIPHLFIVQNVFYPQKAIEKDIKGKVVVALDINVDGKVTAAKVESSTARILNEEVLKAVRKFPKEWKWVPATINNKATTDVYRIVVHFDLD